MLLCGYKGLQLSKNDQEVAVSSEERDGSVKVYSQVASGNGEQHRWVEPPPEVLHRKVQSVGDSGVK